MIATGTGQLGCLSSPTSVHAGQGRAVLSGELGQPGPWHCPRAQELGVCLAAQPWVCAAAHSAGMQGCLLR